MKKIIIAFCAVMTLTGCSSDGRVNEKAYLRAAALDGDRMTFVFYSEDDSAVTITADTPETAKSQAELAVGKEIFTGHTELILLNDCDNREILDYLLHKWKLSPSCMVVLDEKNGERLLTEKKVENLTGALKCAHEQGIAPEYGIVEVLSKELKKGSES